MVNQQINVAVNPDADRQLAVMQEVMGQLSVVIRDQHALYQEEMRRASQSHSRENQGIFEEAYQEAQSHFRGVAHVNASPLCTGRWKIINNNEWKDMQSSRK